MLEMKSKSEAVLDYLKLSYFGKLCRWIINDKSARLLYKHKGMSIGGVLWSAVCVVEELKLVWVIVCCSLLRWLLQWSVGVSWANRSQLQRARSPAHSCKHTRCHRNTRMQSLQTIANSWICYVFDWCVKLHGPAVKTPKLSRYLIE